MRHGESESLFACQAAIDQLKRNLDASLSGKERRVILRRLRQAEIARFRTVAVLNLHYFRRILADEALEERRVALLTLIAEEEGRLSALENASSIDDMD